MIRKTLTIPIYDCTADVVITDNFEEAAIEAGYDGVVDGHDAGVFRYPDRPSSYTVIFHEKSISAGNIAHEALHLMHDIMEYVGMGPELNDDESQAYLIGFIVDGIHQIIDAGEAKKKKA